MRLLLLPIACLAVALPGCTATRPSGAPSPLQDGQRALREGRADEAIAQFRLALAARPQDPAPMRGLVEAHAKSGRLDAMTDELRRALTVRPGDAQAHFGLGLTLFARSPADEAGAAEHLRRATELAPEVAEYSFRLGVLHLDCERWAPAADALRRARDLAPEFARHHIALAQALARLGDRTGAKAAVRAVLELKPEAHDLAVARQVVQRLAAPAQELPAAVEADFQTGLEYMERHDAPQQAIVAFQEILSRFPDLGIVHAALGLCFQRLDDAGRALDEFQEAIALSPDDPAPHLYLADLFWSRERFDRAAEEYQAALERDPLCDRAYERLAELAVRRADAAAAARSYRLVSLLRPGDLAAQLSFGASLLASGALDEAERELSAAVAAEPKSAEGLLQLGLLHLERRKSASDPALARQAGEKAAGCFERVLDLQPQNAHAARLLQQARAP